MPLFLSPRLILIALAVIPAVVLMRYVYRSDRLEKESPAMLRSLVLYGILSTAVACLLEIIGEKVLGALVPRRSRSYDILLYFVIVGLSEEGAKFALLKKRTWRSPEFNCQFDGVVYAVFVSLGFALWENVRYVLSYGLGTALIRAVTAIPGHACFGVFMGVWYGVAKRFDLLGDAGASKTCLVLSVVLPVLTHGLYDYLAVSAGERTEFIFLAYIAVLFLVSFRLVRKMSVRDRPLPRRF